MKPPCWRRSWDLDLNLGPFRFLQRYKLFFRGKTAEGKVPTAVSPAGEGRGLEGGSLCSVGPGQQCPADGCVSRYYRGRAEGREQSGLNPHREICSSEDFYLWIYTHFGLSETKSPSREGGFRHHGLVSRCHLRTGDGQNHPVPGMKTRLSNTCYVFLEDWLREVAGPEGAQTPGATGLSGLITMRSNLQISTLSTMIKTLKPPAFVSWAFVHTCKMTWRARYSSLTAHGGSI